MILPADTEEEFEIPTLRRRVLRDSIVVEILNPKTALFFLTFLPQFVDSNATTPACLQFLMLGIIVNAAFSIGDLASVGLAAAASPLVSSNNSASWVAKASGIVLVGLSVAIMMRYV